jgi:two-component system phosphate regulon response regulator PhoB
LRALQAVLRRCAPEFVKGTLSVGPVELDTVASYEARVGGRRITLTPTEFRLLRFLMANPGRVYSRQQLLDNVWGDHVYIEDRTVDIHIRRLRVALGPAAEHLVETVRGAGYKLSAPPELSDRAMTSPGAGARIVLTGVLPIVGLALFAWRRCMARPGAGQQ